MITNTILLRILTTDFDDLTGLKWRCPFSNDVKPGAGIHYEDDGEECSSIGKNKVIGHCTVRTQKG